MRPWWIVVLVSSLFSSLALAQAPPDEDPLPAPPPGEESAAPPATLPPATPQLDPSTPGYPPPGALGHRPLSPAEFEMWLRMDHEFRSGKRRRLAGILVTTIGGSTTIAIGLLLLAASSLCDDRGDCESRDAAIGFFIVTGISLAVGLPLWISGQHKMNRVRAQRILDLKPAVGFLPGRGGARLDLAWRF